MRYSAMASPTTSSFSSPATSPFNRWDALKLLALISMTIDHVGEYFFPENQWFRVAGRFAMPIFLFLVGYAGAKPITARYCIWMLAPIAIDAMLGEPIMPLNILVTIFFCRYGLQKMEESGAPRRLWPGWFFLIIPVIPMTSLLSDYGTVSFLMALAGYYKRHENNVGRAYAMIFLAGSLVIACSYHLYFSTFTAVHTPAMIVVYTLLWWLLVRFDNLPLQHAAMPRWLSNATTFFTRHSLQYYVLHVALLQIAARLFMQ